MSAMAEGMAKVDVKFEGEKRDGDVMVMMMFDDKRDNAGGGEARETKSNMKMEMRHGKRHRKMIAAQQACTLLHRLAHKIKRREDGAAIA